MRFNQRGGVFLEIFGAFCLLLIILVPVIGGFTTGVRQTHTVRSYMSARAIAQLALSLARAEVAMGTATEESATNLTADVRRLYESTAAQLQGLQVTRSMELRGAANKLFLIKVRVAWNDPYMRSVRAVEVETVERGQS